MPISPYNYLKSLNINKPSQNNFQHCYSYGCKTIVDVSFSDNDWKIIDEVFTPPPKTPEEERKYISLAIGKFELITGEKTGTKADQYGTFRNLGKFQQDCIDESVNTTIYLSILNERGLIKFHTPSVPDTRFPIIHSSGRWPHRTAVIYEKNTDKSFAVDSWFHDNGFPAEIVPMVIWKKGWKAKENFRTASDKTPYK